MKIAEALLHRSYLKNKLASLRERIARNSLVQEGNEPHEDPNALIEEAFVVINEFEKLVTQINVANLDNRFDDGRTLTAVMAQRMALVDSHALVRTAIVATEKEPDRYSSREIKWLATVDVARLQRNSEDIARQVRELNVRIQEANWRFEI